MPLEELLLRDAEEGVSDKGVQAIILEPTRELAIQVKAQVDKFSSLSSVLVYGGDGVKAHHNMSDIRRKKPQVIIATPGRLIDLCDNYDLDLSESRYQILDEGDKMLDMGFDKDVARLQQSMPDAQTMIFSATMPSYIQKIAKDTMTDPIMIDLVGTETNQIPERIKNIAVITSG